MYNSVAFIIFRVLWLPPWCNSKIKLISIIHSNTRSPNTELANPEPLILGKIHTHTFYTQIIISNPKTAHSSRFYFPLQHQVLSAVQTLSTWRRRQASLLLYTASYRLRLHGISEAEPHQVEPPLGGSGCSHFSSFLTQLQMPGKQALILELQINFIKRANL